MEFSTLPLFQTKLRVLKQSKLLDIFSQETLVLKNQMLFLSKLVPVTS